MSATPYPTNPSASKAILLSPEELQDLTGLQQFAAQKRWLDANGWRYTIDVRGRPKVARSYFEKRMTEDEQVKAEPNRWAVNVMAIRA